MRMSKLSMNKRKPLFILASLQIILFSFLLMRFYTLQIIEGEKWSAIAEKQHYLVINTPFHRGTFYSNALERSTHPDQPQKLAFDIKKYHLHIDPFLIPEYKKNILASLLWEELDLPNEEKINFFAQFKKESRCRAIVHWLDEQEKIELELLWTHLYRKLHIPRNALFFLEDYERSYPFGPLLGQVLHTLQKKRDLTSGLATPTGGLELSYNQFLQGKMGKKRLLRSPYHAFETGEILEKAKDGEDIHLSVNHVLQAICEEEIQNGVLKTQAKGGWALMMDPYTGEILASAQYPFFDLKNYPEYYNHKELLEHTECKAISLNYEPGSIFKPITVALALIANEELKAKGEPQIFFPKEKISIGNGQLKGRSKPLKDIGTHKYLNAEMALQKSANIYFAKLMDTIVLTMGAEWVREKFISVFGFGEKTGVELHGEGTGFIPIPLALHSNGTLQWSRSTPYSLAIGHNIQVTTIQILRAYCLFINGGYLVRPTFLKVDEPPIFPHVLNDEIANSIAYMLQYVTKPGGTGSKADIHGYTEAGKTASANKVINGKYSNEEFYSGFIGFTPADHPLFVLSITLDAPQKKYIPGFGYTHRGGSAAAPIFQSIGKRSLEYLGVPKNDPHGYPKDDPRFDELKAHFVLEAKQLQEKYKSWNK